MKRSRSIQLALTAVLVAATVILFGISPVAAQSSLPRVGVLTPGMTFGPVLEGFREGLARLGYREARDLTIIIEDTGGETSDLVPRAAKLLEAKPDVLFTVTTPHAAAAKQATTTIPIVFAWTGDPVLSHLVASYASSKNNLTGVSTYAAHLSGKRLELLKEIAPRTRGVLAVISAKESIAEISFLFLGENAKKIGIQVFRRDVTTKEDIERLLLEKRAGSVDAIFHVPSVFVGNHIGSLIEKAKRERMPLIVHEESMTKMGALASYGADFRLLGAQAAKLVAKVLKGARPSEIPIETPDRLFLAVNLTTAKIIGLKIPRGVLERADSLLE